METAQRIVFLDYLRVIACFMVILVHSCEFYYCGPTEVFFNSVDDRFWVALIDSALRAAVPLFVMASSYLLVPLTTDSTTFFKRRFVRVFVPFVIWSVLYACLPVWLGRVDGDVAERLSRLMYNFNGDSGHLWFIYMLIGVYLVMPIISPWLKQVSRRGEECFLVIWGVTTLWGYLHPWLGNLWGEAIWNDFHALYYFSGFIGYVVLAHYFRTYIHWTTAKSVAIGLPIYLVGYAITAIVFYRHGAVSTDFAYVEQSWNFCTFNVALMTIGLFLMLSKINYKAKGLYGPVQQVSKLSYGIYLMHIMLLGFVYDWIAPLFSTPVSICLMALICYAGCIAITKLLSYIPQSKWVIG